MRRLMLLVTLSVVLCHTMGASTTRKTQQRGSSFDNQDLSGSSEDGAPSASKIRECRQLLQRAEENGDTEVTIQGNTEDDTERPGGVTKSLFASATNGGRGVSVRKY